MRGDVSGKSLWIESVPLMYSYLLMLLMKRPDYYLNFWFFNESLLPISNIGTQISTQRQRLFVLLDSDADIGSDKSGDSSIEEEPTQLDEIDEFALQIHAPIDGGKTWPQTKSSGPTCTRIKTLLISYGPGPIWRHFEPQKPMISNPFTDSKCYVWWWVTAHMDHTWMHKWRNPLKIVSWTLGLFVLSLERSQKERFP